MNVDAMAVDLGLAIPEKADVIMNGMDENGSLEHSVEELQRELFVVSDGQIPLGDLLSRVMQASYAELSEMAETLPNMSDVARKRTLADWAVKIKKQVVKLYAVAKWARDAETVQKCMNITAFLLDQNQQFEEVKQRLVYARESLDPARLRNHDLLTSLDVLTTGTYRRLPSIFKKTIVRPPALTDEEVAKTLLDLESAIRFRLRLSEIIPMEMSKYRIANGRVYFSVPKLFETSVSLVGVEKTDGWFFIHVEFLINIGGDMTDTQEFPRLPTGVTKRFIAVEIMSHLSKYLPVTQPLPPGVEPPPQLPAGTVDAPLIRMFNFLQIMSLSYQLEILWYQAARMQSLGWGDYLKTTMSPDRKEMTVTYWTRTAPPTMGGQAGRARQVSLYGGTVTIAIVNEDKTSASSSIHQLSPRARVMAQLHAKSKLGNLAPSDEIERLVFKLKWQPADFAFGVVIPQEETALPDGVLEIDADNLDFSALLHLILMRHARAVLATIQMKLQTDVMTMNVFSAPGAVTLIEDGASHALRVHLCEDEVVFVTIDSRTGRLNMRDTGDLAAAGRAPRFVAISDKVNEQPTKMLEALIRLRFTTITDLAEQKARYLGMQSYRRRNFLQDELHKLGEAARGTLFIQLAAFPSHYLVIVITDMEYQYALISTSVIPGSMFGNMVMEDIAWLDLSRIHGDEAVRAASTTTPNDHPLNGSSKRKRSQDRPADLHSSSRGFHLETSILRELYSYCCARVAYMNVELQFKLRGIPYDRVNLANSTPLTPELAHIQSSLARSVPSLCVQSTDILSGAPAAEAAMPNIRVIPLNWWSEKASQVVTCVKLKYVQQPLGKRAGSSVIRPSKRIIYDTTQAVVSFLSENAATCVDEFLEEWARVSKMVVIAREVAQLAKERQFEDLRLLSFDLQTVEFAYASRFTVSISSEEQLSFIGGGSFHLRFSTTRDAATDQSDDVDMADLDDMYNPHEDAEPFLRNVLRHGPELAPSLHRLVVLLRDTLPIAKVLEEIRRDSNTTRGPDWFAKSAGWYRLVYGDLRHALDFRLMTEQRVAIIDASQSQSSGDQPIAIDTQIIGFAPIPQFKTIVFDVVKDVLAGSTADSTPRNITPMDIGAVCHVGLVGDLANRLHSRIASLIAPPS